MIEKDKTYTYEELKEILPKASAEVVVKLTNEMKSAGCDDVGFVSMMSLNNTLTLAELAKILFHKVEEEKEEK
ncbi:MAG: hypothetical protein IKN65_00205 [Clostridia bacterium]|nr:hypothetical protein [Bacilli bacterium]MBR3672705.1 hypothetical protein [Clostridia bacterium]MBR4671579.1 hypothetical protein [Bacilli bacterium]MBR6113523.1 hypothetical protein [Bacilli bacterium]